ncbi:MAG: hypothetical protein QOG93_290, partial [Gaiellaceae bacterium]|nr:hypothetical protein [Gaiellaceae bacterium]
MMRAIPVVKRSIESPKSSVEGDDHPVARAAL